MLLYVDMGFWGWFYFLSFFYILASMLYPCFFNLMMDGHKHHAVAVGEWCFSIVCIYFDLYCEQPLRQPSLASHRKYEVDVCAMSLYFKRRIMKVLTKNNSGKNNINKQTPFSCRCLTEYR